MEHSLSKETQWVCESQFILWLNAKSNWLQQKHLEQKKPQSAGAGGTSQRG